MSSSATETRSTVLRRLAAGHRGERLVESGTPGGLDRLPVIIIDCQTTGATPGRGHLLEVGWRVAAADDPERSSDIACHLVELPPDASIPPAITRLTGITERDLASAIPRAELWSRLRSAAPASDDGAGAALPGDGAIAVAHFARFEEQFLRDLQAGCESGREFPFRFICTHEIGRRLFPDLPRRGLRALAGYFGVPVSERKRAAAHVSATGVVWSRLVALLARDHGVSTLTELDGFLSGPPPDRGPRWSVPLPRERRLRLPEGPGVYRFRNQAGQILYVGKARSLRKRVNSYYRKRRAGEKLLELVSQVREIDATETATALEAAVLEAEEIKRLDPPYNRALRELGRGVWFASPSFASLRRVADAVHEIGPLPYREPFDAVGEMNRLIGSAAPAIVDEGATIRRLGLSPFRLAPDALDQGLRLLRERHRSADASPPRLLGRGAEIWRRRLAEKAAAADAGDVDPAGPDDLEPDATRPDPSDEPAPALDASGVADHLDGTVVHASRLVRRARWLTLLAGSTIAWSGGKSDAGRGPDHPAMTAGPGRATHVIRIRDGDVRVDSPADVPATLPPPSGKRVREIRRHIPFDRAMHDRLRVISTELRRLVAESRPVTVTLPTGRRLGPDQLRRVLEMV